MKKIINSERASLLKYDIRALTVVAEKLKTFVVNIWAWENIGDPIVQGHEVPSWMKTILKKATQKNANWGYSPTEGLNETRKFIAGEENKKGLPLKKSDVVFTSGLGHAINIF